MISDPPVQAGQTEFTTSQKMGAVALNAITGALEEESPIVLTDGNSKIYVPN